MALSVSRNDREIPKDAVKLQREEALNYQMHLIQKWEPLSEVFSLRAGPGILALIAGISGTFVLAHFRKKLKLGVYGKVTSYFPGVVLPSGLAALLHSSFVQNKILLSEYECPLCLQTRGAMLQVGTGLIYPLLLSPMASFVYATRHFTVRLPYITEQPKEWLKLWIKLMRSTKGMAGYIFAANVIGAFAVTTLEFRELANIQAKLYELEKQADRGDITLE